MWESWELFPEEAIEVLQKMSLIKIKEDNCIWMRDQLRDLGHEIIHQECAMRSEKQSRVWNHDDVFDLLMRTKGLENVEAICLKFESNCEYNITYEVFASLSNLRFLQVDRVNFNETSTNLHCFAQVSSFQCGCHLNVLPASFFRRSPYIFLMLR